ncbi:MAG: hypothetical protein IPK64_21535 [bacterium]|nr:hypothetical protein [bacterium]HHW78698.1 hypothetical protein [Xanthomonadaceae bacterium]
MKSFSKAVFLGLTIGLLSPAVADDLLQGGRYKEKSTDFPRHVTASENPRAPVAAEAGHHADGGQDRSGRDWSKDVIPHDHEHPVDASSSPSPREWGWNSK